MDDKLILNGLIEKLEKDFEISDGLIEINDPGKYLEDIRKHLMEKIIEQMEKNFERFLNTIYRIDLDETKLSEILATHAVADIPEIIADMIIERQMQRVKTQLLYKQGKL